MLVLNKFDPRPIYEQVKENIKKQIVSGVLKPGDRLPSVRELATQLVINPNTIQRAYHELENEGYIYKLAGKGTFVARQKQLPPEHEKKAYRRFQPRSVESFILRL
ncbi:MAG: GntR family transcriptional regulator [Clostridia bacterium]|nr:GntR family transcriptional regulator [Clostridia bacterium]